jgi:ketosteroid isomerase-like protein
MRGSDVAADLGEWRLAMLRDFADAYNRHDVDAIMAFFTDDGVFEGFAGPDPWGERFTGREAVRARVAAFLERVPDAQWIDARHAVVGDRGFSEWTYVGTDSDGTRARRNGIDAFVFRGPLIASKSTYQKRVD